MFRIKWNLNHLYTTFGTRDSEFSHFFQKLAKKQPNCPIHSFLGFATIFFGIAVWFYIEMTFYLPFHWYLIRQIIKFVNLPKFTQMPVWWRHEGTKFWFPKKMTFIFGFLDERSIQMPSGYLISWLRRILSSIEFSHLYRDCIGKYSFCTQWRHQRYSCKTLIGSRFRKN